MRTAYSVALFTVLILCCKPADAPPEPQETPRKDPACTLACAQLEALSCPEGQKPDGGDTCYVVCQRSRSEHLAALPAECVAKARTVSDVRACGVLCK